MTEDVLQRLCVPDWLCELEDASAGGAEESPSTPQQRRDRAETDRRVREFAAAAAGALRAAARASALPRAQATPVLVACATFSCVGCCWVTPETTIAAHDLLDTLAKTLQLRTHDEVVVALLDEVLALLGPRLSGGKWKREAAATRALVWLVTEHVRHPHLSPHAGPLVTLGAALLGDAGHAGHRILGARLVAHCAAQLNAAELRWYCDLLRSELAAVVHTKELSVLRVGLPCAVAVARVFGGSGGEEQRFRCELLDAWADALRFSTERARRAVLLGHLGTLLGVVGVTVAMPLLPVLVAAVSDALASPSTLSIPLQVNAIACAEQLLRICWPRMRQGHHLALVHALALGCFCEGVAPATRQRALSLAKLIGACCAGTPRCADDFTALLCGVPELSELLSALTAASITPAH